MERPNGVPDQFEDHAKLMVDLRVLAYQADMTRVITFMMGREGSNRSYPSIGVADAHHPITHHQNNPGKIAKTIKVNELHIEMFAYMLDKMRSTKDGEGSLLDHSMIVHGSSISDGNLHTHHDLPIVVAGGGAGRLQGGRHLRYPKETPMNNLLLSLLDKAGGAAAVSHLLAHGADANATESRKGQNALMWAAAEGHADVAEVLMERGADVNAASKSGFTPLMFAAMKGDVGSTSSLLAAGADANSSLPSGNTALNVAAAYGNTIDVVGGNGWAEAPEDRINGTWTWHGDFELGRVSVPFLVRDVDEDGDNDLVYSIGHGYGLFWQEQVIDENGRQWRQHDIDTTWSQAHFLLWEDLDQNGRGELTAGKRYMAHGGRDPGANEPLAIYRYEFDPETKKWGRWTISRDDGVGFGLDAKAIDIDGDGDLDLVAPGRSGLYLLENQLK